MRRPFFLPQLVMLLTCTYSLMGYGEDSQDRLYWVVGSFSDQSTAMQAGEKISRQSGLEILYTVSEVNRVTYYRLLAPQFNDSQDQSNLMAELGSAGVDNPWPLKLAWTDTNSLFSPDEPGNNLYLVVGSFNQYEEAQQYVEDILNSYNQIAEMHEFAVNGVSVVRVMIGPYVDHNEIAAVKDSLHNSGLADAWIIEMQSPSSAMMNSYDSFVNADTINTARPDRELILKKATRQSSEQPENTINPGFNLARLRKQ